MNHIQAYLAANSLDADAVTLTGTCARRLAYSKGSATVLGVDFYALDVLKIVITAPDFREELTSGPEFDDAVELLEGSDSHPILFVSAPAGSTPNYPELELSVSYSKALRWSEANERLSTWSSMVSMLRFKTRGGRCSPLRKRSMSTLAAARHSMN
jgi:hypothetical protein